MFSPDGSTPGHNKEPALMVIKNGSRTGVTVGCLNNIRAVSRVYSTEKNITGKSMEVVVLSRPNSSAPFSRHGDSGSLVVDGRGRACGIITSGDAGGMENKFDMTYLTSINFILKRLAEHGIDADISLSPADLQTQDRGVEDWISLFFLPIHRTGYKLFIFILTFSFISYCL